MRRVLTAVVCLVAAALVPEVRSQDARPGRSRRTPDSVVHRFLASEGRPVTSFRGIRTLEAAARGGKMRATLTAETSLDPITGFSYTVLREDGSAVISRKVLHAALQAEQSIRSDPEQQRRAALDETNYDFADAHIVEGGLLEVAIRPRRSDTLLVAGRLLLTQDDADLVRVEGRLIQRPSFWTRKVEVVREYARLGGVRVPMRVTSTAQVLLVGTSTFSMRYEYETINGQTVGAAISHPDQRRQ